MESLVWLLLEPRLLVGIVLGLIVSYCVAHKSRHYTEPDERRKAFFAQPASAVPPSVDYSRGWSTNSRGMVMASQQFLPVDRAVKACVGLCHGFGDHTNGFMFDFAVRLASDGFAVLAMDVEGHGLSDGVHGCIHDLHTVAVDLADYFEKTLEELQLDKKPFFVYGVSMGGAVAFNISTIRKCSHIQHLIKGVILSAPMVKVSDEMRPPDLVVRLLSFLSEYIPLAPLAPIPDIAERCFRRKDALQRARSDILAYKLKPRLKTALAMLEATMDVTRRLGEMKHPILILHGGQDVVTCPELSKTLYEEASSEDKTLRIYPESWHDLLGGEPHDQIDKIYEDIISWIQDRSRK